MVEKLGDRHAAEVEDAELLDVPMKIVDVLMSERAMDGVTLASVAKQSLGARAST
jgi:putative transport protein